MIELATVLVPPVPDPLNPLGAWHVQVVVEPDGRVVDALVGTIGQGLGKGMFWPLVAKERVILLFPSGDPMRAVVLGSLGIGATFSPNPVANTGLRPLLMHPLGVELRSADGLPAHGLVLATLFPDLLGFLTALQAFMAAVTAAGALTPAAAATAAIGAAATAFTSNPAVATLATGLTASAVPNAAVPPGFGAPPYATPTHKATL